MQVIGWQVHLYQMYIIVNTYVKQESGHLNILQGMNKISISVLFLFLLLLTGNTATAQTYREAKDLATSGEHAKARDLCRKILAQEFDSDVATLHQGMDRAGFKAVP
jgi:hypothetical protein